MARVIQWCYLQTFDRVCTNKISSGQSRSELPQTLQQVTNAEAYGLDHEEDALTSTSKVSAEVYELAHRFFMPELCRYVVTEMLERYRTQTFTSWPSVIFDTLARASTDDTDFRAMLCEVLAAQTFLEPPEYSRSPRLRSLADDDPEFFFELMYQKDRLNQRYRERVKRVAVATGSDLMEKLELELSGQGHQSQRQRKGFPDEPRTDYQCGHDCTGTPVLNVLSGRLSYWHQHRWVERG